MLYSVELSQPASNGDVSWAVGSHGDRDAAIEQATEIIDQVLLHLEGEMRQHGERIAAQTLIEAYRERGDLPTIWVEDGTIDPFDAWTCVAERAALLSARPVAPDLR
jgi:hypothetical protein